MYMVIVKAGILDFQIFKIKQKNIYRIQLMQQYKTENEASIFKQRNLSCLTECFIIDYKKYKIS